MPSSTKPRVRLRVENFGPIVEGEVEFKPLTLFIGPNNSGKSYLATLLYALKTAFAGATTGMVLYRENPNLPLMESVNAIANAGPQIAAENIPESVLSMSKGLYKALIDNMEGRLEATMQRYLNTESLSLLGHSRKSGRHWEFQVLDSQSRKLVDANFSEDLTKISVRRAMPDTIDAIDSESAAFLRAHQQRVPYELAGLMWESVARRFGFEGSTTYLPSSRSGILLSWPLIASQAVQRLSRVRPLADSEAISLPGIVADFLEVAIADIFTGYNGDIETGNDAWNRSTLEVVEGRMLRGKIEAGGAESYSVRLDYVSDSGSIPVQRASSMVGEIAPLDLWIKKVLSPGDLLIIDEPEAHLHPANQRLVAQTLVRLVNAGVDVVAPTHSATILHQVSNLLTASELDDDIRLRLGFTEADRISYDDVAVYLFDLQADGTHIRPVEIERGFGISEDEFVRVAEALGEESLRVSYAMAQQPA